MKCSSPRFANSWPERPQPRGSAKPLRFRSSSLNSSRISRKRQWTANSNPSLAVQLELDSVIEILYSRHKKNPVLIGERGAGKTAIVHGLAQRIADGGIPPFLADKRILALEPELIAGFTRDRLRLEELTKLVGATREPSEVILFIDGLQDLLASTGKSAAPDGARILQHAILYVGIQCITTGTASECAEPTQAVPWFGNVSARFMSIRSMRQPLSACC